MSGKAYTMKEMRQIVEYLTENKYYSETRGRKMWKDFENTSLTNRTWQSLKETFLKRILPNIHDPYYKLSKEQIISFRQGYDVQKKGLNKLEVHTINDDRNSEEAQQVDDKQQKTIEVNDEKAGEDIKYSKITTHNTSSADIVVFQKAYETAEDIQKVLESHKPNKQLKDTSKLPKKIKDFIRYSEPLAPILQEILDDFGTDAESSDREPLMEINEREPDRNNLETTNKKNDIPMLKTYKKNESLNVAVESKEISMITTNDIILSLNKDSETQPTQASVEMFQNNSINEIMPVEGINQISEQPSSNIGNVEKEKNSDETYFFTNKDSKNICTCPKTREKELTNDKNYTENCSDFVLPNNQEGLITTETQKKNGFNENIIKDKGDCGIKATRKRAVSEDNALFGNKKKNVDTNVKGNKIIQDSKTVTSNSVETMIETSEEVVANVLYPNFDKATTSKEPPFNVNEYTTDAQMDKYNNTTKSPSIETLCSLEKQFNKTKYAQSEAGETNLPITKSSKQVSKAHKNVPNINKVLSACESDFENQDKSKEKESRITMRFTKSHRDKVLANIFGFSNGAGTTTRKTRSKHKRSTCHHKKINNKHSTSSTSDWTSESENEDYMSPPCRRRSKHCGRKRRPSLNTLEQDGNLFAMIGTKIYPVMQNGKIVKYNSYLTNGDAEDKDAAFWKLKYEEEKKEKEEFKRLLDQSREPRVSRDRTTPTRRSTSHYQESDMNQQPQPLAVPSDSGNKSINGKPTDTHVSATTAENITLKMSKNNKLQEVYLAGDWTRIIPAFEQVVNILHKESEHKILLSNTKVLELQEVKQNSSKGSSPIIFYPEIRSRVDLLEKEIFDEIEMRDKIEESVVQTDYVTKRIRRQLRTPSVASVHTPETKTNIVSKNDETKIEESITENQIQVQAVIEHTHDKPENVSNARRTRSSTKTKDSSTPLDEVKPIKYTTRSSIKRDSTGKDNDNICYMLPPKKRPSSNKNLNGKNAQKKSKSSTNLADITTVDGLSLISESTQGYHESDNSPIHLKKKKKDLSLVVRSTKRPQSRISLRKSLRLRSRNQSDTSNSSRTPSKVIPTRQSTSEIYNSESYKGLFPSRYRSANRLDNIDELETIQKTDELRNFEAVSNVKEHSVDIKTHLNDAGSSSSISLPLSPELSIVESISVRKDMLMSTEDNPIINEIQDNNINIEQRNANFFICNVDITIPLMQQTCEIQETNTSIVNSSNRKNRTAVSESLLNGIQSVNIYDNSSDSIDRKLNELLLESNKKLQHMEIDHNSAIKTKRSRAKNRCSTPHKRTTTKKYRNSKVEAIVEEHMETCSYGGRVSCPPTIQVFDDTVKEHEDNVINKKRQKKDIIKVKILKPKPNKNKRYEMPQENNNNLMILADSGINEMAIFSPDSDSSVELIHNHSETCLHANECVNDGTISMQNSHTFSHNSDSLQSTDTIGSHINEIVSTDNNDNIQLFNNEYDSTNKISRAQSHLSPTESNCSLITEDLSDEASTQIQLSDKPTKWFLLSEDEYSKSSSNVICPQSTAAGWGSNLNEIFPITFSIPNLSDITEASRENDDSRKPMDV